MQWTDFSKYAYLFGNIVYQFWYNLAHDFCKLFKVIVKGFQHQYEYCIDVFGLKNLFDDVAVFYMSY